ncbi:hypothetical protein [Gemmiger sp.]|uniref:hypothetical protein n=1 Tax=Gemmiger sp. TaxID=2049027 RepID=UPI003A911147
MLRLPNANRWGTVLMPFPVPIFTVLTTTMQKHRGFFMPAFDRMRSGRAIFMPKIKKGEPNERKEKA